MNIYTDFDSTKTNELCKIMELHGSDKGKEDNTGWHNYTTYYNELFIPVRGENLRVFEMGLGTNNVNIPSNMGRKGHPGASLRGWRDYFPNARIFGADIDRDILFAEDHIQTFYCDQTDPKSITALWAESVMNEGFDVIMDDGLHTFEANKCMFENSIHKLKVGGVYIIEDILNECVDAFAAQIETWKTMYPNLVLRLLTIPHHNPYDNRLLMIQRTT